MIPKKFLVLFTLAFVARLSADPVVVDYYEISGSPGYWDDTGKQLTDGLYAPYTPGSSLANDGGYAWVGWDRISPTITFHFANIVTINTVTLHSILWTDAAVYLPGQVTINGDAFTATTNGIGSYTNKNEVTFNFHGSWTGDELVMTLGRANSDLQWLFADEVSFSNRPRSNVPDSGSTVLFTGLGLLSLVGVRRWRKSA